LRQVRFGICARQITALFVTIICGLTHGSHCKITCLQYAILPTIDQQTQRFARAAAAAAVVFTYRLLWLPGNRRQRL